MYSTDLEETQWQVIKKILNVQERKRKYDLREIWNAIFYVVKTGCQWRMLPSDFAPWELVYYYYRKWSSWGEFDLLLNNLREKVRVKMGQKQKQVWVSWIVKVYVGVIIVLLMALTGTKSKRR